MMNDRARLVFFLMENIKGIAPVEDISLTL
jgi:hypothetical protein